MTPKYKRLLKRHRRLKAAVERWILTEHAFRLGATPFQNAVAHDYEAAESNLRKVLTKESGLREAAVSISPDVERRAERARARQRKRGTINPIPRDDDGEDANEE